MTEGGRGETAPAAQGPAAQGQGAQTVAQPRPGALRLVLFALVPVIVLFALLEGLLWVLGAGAPVEQLSLSRGFDENVSYVLPDEGPPGSWRTQMNEGQLAEIHVPPKGARTRVLLIGESNVEIFPDEWLEEELNRAAPDPGFEVFNFGRRGYGSERLRILVRQAMVIEPDVVLFYVGHNEFVEGEFKIQLRERGESWLAEMGTHVRTVNVLSDLLRGMERPSLGTGAVPESRQMRGHEFDDITPQVTRLYYDAFRENLRSMCRTALDAGAGVVLATPVTNVLVVPSVARHPASLAPEQVAEFDRLRVGWRTSVPQRLVAGLAAVPGAPEVVHLHFEDWNEGTPPVPNWKGQAAPALRPLSGPLAGGPLWAHPSRWLKNVWQLLGTMQVFHERAITPEERTSLRRAVAAAEAALTISPEHARMTFELGLAVYLLGEDDARAVELLHAAADADAAPTHANRIVQDIVRETAAAFPEIAFVDTDRIFRDACPNRLPGYEVLMDNCHLHPGARKALLAACQPEILRLARD